MFAFLKKKKNEKPKVSQLSKNKSNICININSMTIHTNLNKSSNINHINRNNNTNNNTNINNINNNQNINNINSLRNMSGDKTKQKGNQINNNKNNKSLNKILNCNEYLTFNNNYFNTKNRQNINTLNNRTTSEQFYNTNNQKETSIKQSEEIKNLLDQIKMLNETNDKLLEIKGELQNEKRNIEKAYNNQQIEMEKIKTENILIKKEFKKQTGKLLESMNKENILSEKIFQLKRKINNIINEDNYIIVGTYTYEDKIWCLLYNKLGNNNEDKYIWLEYEKLKDYKKLQNLYKKLEIKQTSEINELKEEISKLKNESFKSNIDINKCSLGLIQNNTINQTEIISMDMYNSAMIKVKENENIIEKLNKELNEYKNKFYIENDISCISNSKSIVLEEDDKNIINNLNQNLELKNLKLKVSEYKENIKNYLTQLNFLKECIREFNIKNEKRKKEFLVLLSNIYLDEKYIDSFILFGKSMDINKDKIMSVIKTKI